MEHGGGNAVAGRSRTWLEDHVRPSVKENPPKSGWKLKNVFVVFFCFTFYWASMTYGHGLIPTSTLTWTKFDYNESNLTLEIISFGQNPSSLLFSKAIHMVQEYPEKTGGRDKPIIQQRHKLRAYKGQVLSYYWSGLEPWREQTPTVLFCWLAVIWHSFVFKEKFSCRLTPISFIYLIFFFYN